MTYLNLCEHNGLILYEWNLFRNLLQNGRILVFKNKNIEVAELGKMTLDDPSEIFETYFFNNALIGTVDVGLTYREGRKIYESQWASFEMCGLKFKSRCL
ncbi:MAG: hypothetical protein EOP04_08475 [Proteobacteria bacterium]|nr:MAG: hypothetical protein EOP04_08475 [Pseudomonadota bacterium]